MTRESSHALFILELSRDVHDVAGAIKNKRQKGENET